MAGHDRTIPPPNSATAVAHQRLDVVCLGASTAVDHALRGDVVASIALVSGGSPIFLVGAGAGCLRQCIHHFGRVPPSIFLPSSKTHYTSELQALIEYEASYGRRVAVYAPADVLDVAIATIDEDIVPTVKESVEFLQVELGAPTSIHSSYFLLTQRCETASPRYNFVVLDIYQRPVLAFLEGPLSYSSVFSQAACALVRCHRGFDPETLYNELKGTKLLALGYSSDRAPQITAPAAALRAGDTFVVPSVKGGTSTAPFDGANRSAAPQSSFALGRDANSSNDADLTWITNAGERRLGVPNHFGNKRNQDEDGRPSIVHNPIPGSQPATSRTHDNNVRGNPAMGALDHEDMIYGANARRRASPVASNRANNTSMDFHSTTQPPKKIYVFSNENKHADPVIVMVPEHMQLQALKAKIGSLLNIRPFGSIFTVDGGMVRHTDDLEHCQEVVATKHAGAPFDLRKLPKKMRYSKPALGASQAMPFI